jgi:hypothetical protein
MVGAVALRRIHSGLRALLACMIFAGMVCSLVSPAFAAGGQTGILAGTVTDSASQPIANASVSAASPSGSYSVKTGANGSFSVVGVNIDTYTISVSAPGYDTYVLRGATVTGDQTLNLPLILSKTTAVIGRVGARSATSAFQPSQTVDSYTISGARVAQTTGNPNNTNLNDVVLSAPGVTLTENGNPTIRGGSQREVGYQLDGVNFAEPFLSSNGSGGLFSGLGSVQVVAGVGDASQGGIGSGVINVIPKRGTYPGTGDITLGVGGPNFDNTAGIDYGFATPNGQISNYVSLLYNKYAPYYGFFNQNAAAYGNYFGVQSRLTNQFVDNFVFKFGKDNNQSLQVLYENIERIDVGNEGGVPAPGSPDAFHYYPYDPFAIGVDYSLIQPAPYTPTTDVGITQPEYNETINTRFLKLEYDNNINASTFLDIRYYNFERLEADSTLYSLGPFQQGAASWEQEGGPTVGMNFDLTHSFGDKVTVTLNGTYQNQHPVWNLYEPWVSGITPLVGDFGPPTAPCAGIPAGSGYVSCAYPGQNILAPAYGINFNNSYFQNWGVGVRVQYSPSTKLHFDLGARYEGQNQHYSNPDGNPSDINNPFDVPPPLWTAAITNPRAASPRFAVDYQLDQNSAIRASYGRSVVFVNAQNAGTPLGLYGNLAALAALPPDTVGLTPTQIANQCGTSSLPTSVVPLPGVKSFPCANYLQQFYWSIDNGYDAPDAGGAGPSIYSNYDFSFSHQFKNGMALKLTPFYKFGTGLPTASLLVTLPGGSQIFSEGSKGVNRTTGGEFSLTLADHPYGLSGFISGTYQNVLQSAPPLSNGEFNGVPQLSPATIALGDVYRAGYVAPASVRIGATYTFHDGFSITPILQISSGFPYNVGNTLAATLPDGTNANIPQVNFGPGTPILLGYQNAGGTQLNTNYYDPVYSGTQLAPNIAATRGTPGSSQSGGVTWDANAQLNFTLQYKHGKDTFGVQLINVGTNGYNGTTPAVNPFYQPVATGLSGPQTGQNTCTATYGNARGCSAIPTNTYAFTNGAYLLTNGNVGNWQLAPLAPMSVSLFYRRQF